MTIENEVANLTTSVDNLTATVNVKKATLDASVADSESARDQSQAARDTAEDHKLAAEAAATSATNTAASLTGFDLDAIATTKAETAVDVFVYDTSKDSDGGAWRKRTQHTSWYNETLNTATRGSRREFPAVAVIVAEADTLTIYDGDDPALPMWIIRDFPSGYGPNSASSKDGKIIVGRDSAGVVVFDFAASRVLSYREVAGQGGYDAGGLVSGSFVGSWDGSLPTIVSNSVNDVAMTVLPDAPIDPATGLPVPTIAVATAGGVSVITDSGAVYDSGATLNVAKVDFNEIGDLLFTRNGWAASLTYSSVADYASGDGFADLVSNTSGTGIPALQATGFPGVQYFGSTAAIGSNGSIAGNTAVPGLQLQTLPTSDFTKGMSALLTSTYNTGWMNGDIKGAFLSDTDDTDLVGSGELVTNGTFDTDISGWTDASDAGGAISWDASGYLDTTNTSATARAQQSFAVTVGATYVISFEVVSKGGNALFNAGTTAGGTQYFQTNAATTGVFTRTITTTSSTLHIQAATSVAGTTTWDNISVKLADEDRSVNNNGLIVNGTVTRSPVATGADLVSYSGFSTSNYLEQPYNSDLDFGTGDFCVMGWVNLATNTNCVAMSKSPSGSIVSPYFEIQSFDGNYVWVGTGGSGAKNFGPVSIGNWVFLTYARKGGVGYAYLNSRLNESEADTSNYDHSNTDTLSFGLRTDNYGPFSGSLALWRISATAPTAEQIAKIYEDEKFLFQENAQATLYGSSDAVTALAHDPVTDLLHVGTSAGRSVFQGLRRVDNTTDAVGTAISASNNLIVEE